VVELSRALNAATVWEGALHAQLSDTALIGAGYFAASGKLADDTWVTLALQTNTRTGHTIHDREIAERAANQIPSADAVRLMANLLADSITCPPSDLADIQKQARRLLGSSENHLPDNQRRELRDALVNSGSFETTDSPD